MLFRSATWSILAGAGTNALTLVAQTTGGTSKILNVAVTVTNGAGLAATSAPFPITVNPQTGPTVTTTAIVTAYATGLSASVAVQAGASYAWTITGGTITSGAGTSTVTYSAGASGTMTLSCVVTTGSAGASTPGTTAVQVVSAPGLPTISLTGPQSVTSGIGGWKAGASAHAGMAYLWAVSGGVITSLGGPAGVMDGGGATNSITYSVNSSPSSGSLTITCYEINAAGTISLPGTLVVAVAPPPLTPTITAGAPVTTGYGGFTASVPARVGMFYNWSVSGGTVSSANGSSGVTSGASNQITYAVSAAAGGMVVIECVERNAANTPSTAFQVTLSVIASPTQPSLTLSTVPGNAASGYVTTGATISGSVATHPGMTYWWTASSSFSPSPNGATSQGTNSITAVVANAVNSTFVVTCYEENAAGTKSATASVSLVVADVPKLPAIQLASGLSVLGTNQPGLTASVTTRPGMTYNWSVDTMSTSAGAAITSGVGGATQREHEHHHLCDWSSWSAGARLQRDQPRRRLQPVRDLRADHGRPARTRRQSAHRTQHAGAGWSGSAAGIALHRGWCRRLSHTHRDTSRARRNAARGVAQLQQPRRQRHRRGRLVAVGGQHHQPLPEHHRPRRGQPAGAS